jgi:hypothetical protein
MTKYHLKYLKNEAIEDVTALRIREYESKTGVTVKFPVPIEEIVEQVLGLDFDWDVIEEQPGEQILGGLDVASRKILINEAHSDLFEQKPGLLRSTIGHEAGHWDIDVDRSKLVQPMLPGLVLVPSMAKRHAAKADRLIEVLFTLAMSDERAYRVYKQVTAGLDAPEVRSAVDRYQSAMLMPKWLIQAAGEQYDFTRWPDLYRLAEEALVNITNLTVRLQRLGLIYLRDGDKTIYRSEDEFTGQKSLF